MKRVTGIGGIFFKAKNPDSFGKWYADHLGLTIDEHSCSTFHWRKMDPPHEERYTVWSPFEQDTTYFAPSEKAFMINFQVEDLDAVLAQVKREGVDVDPRMEDYEYGRFGWIMDPEGNRIELWEPPRNK